VQAAAMASVDKSGKDSESVSLEASAPSPYFDGKGDVIPSKVLVLGLNAKEYGLTSV